MHHAHHAFYGTQPRAIASFNLYHSIVY